MSVQEKPPMIEILPESAPFSPAQRSWLNGFFAGLLSVGQAPAMLGDAGQNIPQPAEEEDAPWHDPGMEISERLKLAEGKPLGRRMFAAMAQQDCGQCGYLCETYSTAIVNGAESRLNLCAPGGKETARMLKQFARELDPEKPAISIKADVASAVLPPLGTSRDHPAKALFVSRRRLNKGASEKETWHVAFSLEQTGLSYEAGDSFGIFPQNDPRLVDAIIALMGARPEADVGGISLRDHLLSKSALGPAPDSLFQLISLVTGGATRQKARQLAAGEDPDGDLEKLDVLGTLHKFSGLKLGPEAFVEALDPLQPRLYSISSSPRHSPGQLSLTVDSVRYKIGARERLGVASTFLAERIREGVSLPIYVQKAHGFGLPQDPNVPIIMVGPGTGIAPFRAFLLEREAISAKGRNWLFFGHQRSECDFFYEEELSAMQEKGHLTRLTLAWSRDGRDKIYVQDRMREVGRDLWAWLDEGAHFYICGDAKRMARDVERALVDVVAQWGAKTTDEALAFVAGLKKAGRYQADVY